MLTKHDLQTAIAAMRRLEPPLVSLYLLMTPSVRGNNPATPLLRARNALGRFDVPEPVVDRVLHVVRQERHARTTAIFANSSECKVLELAADLPIEDRASGEIDAQWGRPLLAPLRLIENRPRSGIVYVDQDRVRLFEAFLGEIDELDTWTRKRAPSESDALEQSKQVDPAYVPSRGGAAKDNAHAHQTALTARFYRELAKAVRGVIAERGIDSVFVLGPEQDRHAFVDELDPAVRDLLVARLPSLSSPRAKPSEVLDRCEPMMVAEHLRRQRQILADIEGGGRGVTGRGPCTLALTRGRVQKVAVSWQLPPQDRETLLQMAEQSGTDIVFLEDEPGRTLLDRHEGVGAIVRW